MQRAQIGNVSIADFSEINVYPYSPISAFIPHNSSQKAMANAFGRVGEVSLNVVVLALSETSTESRDAVSYGSKSGYPDQDAVSGIHLLDCSFDDPKKRDPGMCVASWRLVNTTVSCQMPMKSRFTTDQDLLIEYGDGTNTSLLWSWPGSRTVTTWASNDALDCGPRCMTVMALVPDQDSTSTGELYHFYNCSSTVGKIGAPENQKEATQNIKNAENAQISDQVAQIFAGSIGWGTPSSIFNDPLTYVQYPESEQFSLGTPGETSEGIANSIAMFSSYSIGTMDRNTEGVNELGYPPKDLQRLKVEWKWVILVLITLPATQLILAIIVTFLSARAVIKDTGYIATAQLLKPTLDSLGSKGSILSGDEIAEHLGKIQLCYGVRDLGSGEYFVDIVNKSELAGDRDDGVWEPGRKMPEGHYDGPET